MNISSASPNGRPRATTTMSDAEVLDFADAQQRRATSPDRSAWVEASAGTGKTKVLTDRVIRLLLAGIKPERILCLTFTKAAAAEMRNRLAGQLGRWAMADQAILDEEIAGLIDVPPDAERRVIARRLFARVLDAPGGINILTIHAFCQALLKRFPLEAAVTPGFEVMDEAEAATVLRHAQDAQLEALARADADPALRAALATVSRRISVAEYSELMAKLLGERAWLLAHINGEAGLDRLQRRLARRLGCEREIPLDEAGLREAARALMAVGGESTSRGQSIVDWLDAGDDRDALSPSYLAVFFKKTDGLLRSQLATRAAISRMPNILAVLGAEAERLDGARSRALVELTVALLRLGLDITDRYSRAKRARGALDYDDLIVAARRLLESAEGAAWVLYKLDGGIDHVLVDEAQDTNPDQWEVIRSLTEEFFSGEGAVDRERTVFAVGDTKQSIFGFQRADPAKLAEMRTAFEGKSRQASKRFEAVDLTVSFRSTPAVLDAVDWVFAQPEAARGVGEPGREILHRANRSNEPGRVELWPLVAAATAAVDTSDYSQSAQAGLGPHEQLARLIASHARNLIGTERRAKNGELLHEGHFMVLVRRRNAFVNALVRELKRKQIEVAGVDRLNLVEELAIQDLIAMARFALLPQDDLNLACLLKSPLVGLDEDKLFTLAWKRTGHLWNALRTRAGEKDFAEAHARLSGWLKRADLTTPFEFFAEALGPEGGRRRLLERLGHEASDPIDELLARALQYQRAEASSLQGFLRWFESGGGEIKRDLDQNRRPEVRILTVHAAKGLQAPIVYLPDTTRIPHDYERILSDDETRLWLPRAGDASEAVRAWRARARERSLEEQNRLLYVAMTRAEDRLYVGGWVGLTKPDKGCWYERISAGLEASRAGPSALQRRRATERTFDFAAQLGKDGWSGKGFELTNEGRIEIPQQAELALEQVFKPGRWIRLPAPVEPDPPTPLAPSQPLPDEARTEPRAFSPLAPDDRAGRWRRGQLMHQLLRSLPAVASPEREAAARRFLAQPAYLLAAEQIDQWAAEALGVTEAAEHATLFAAGSRAEVPLIGTVKTPRGTFTVNGQVDRLAVLEREVLIVDYKTNRPPPETAAAVPLIYRRQLALYRALLGDIYPGRRVRAFLLWTSTPSLMEIDAATLDNSMPYATAP
jgi:ATP-dependent helicase/nuclease subunit A